MNDDRKHDVPATSAKTGFLRRVANQYSGPLTSVALSAVSSWMIVTGLKDLAGFDITQESLLADLAGIVLVIAFVRLASQARDDA